ncbi:hypothetical protein EN808_11805 [Mesorhizobium sp. M8A.F.Ca.ET.165.01.1.1]|uniref:hypothetical protein n=2 Tax=unclassified Mesorhizobium TaxID=325217 RepID=UPI000FD5FD87|nr:hypothetical protein EOA35_27110 [Mesorhizobium sp. M8A.F.Ca.ET.023.01.1.1]RWC78142.1 MAG: hypothetical protein EOS71_02635 [Mesorhizobium sp.]TGP93772.1 hypothetical protein EN861_16920 [Mesorhizobium sp. M8A.F.Ca.ET.218.01.1.1]TGS47745.1 hypothetical protein EN825_01925 [Mesorhizobium sp. M8A.F.Ca.ET.182.01.1.1]TGS83966.1 hypothetical protein EN824_06205 [Mesorhizobium sp. M8A.F.Ca.ET.181.01.1.1]TGT18069.1 hypothetical protein EN856_16450 [Mesorhizobium sp. M8A.F.Ca.ET.213.01.1.1]TGT4257
MTDAHRSRPLHRVTATMVLAIVGLFSCAALADGASSSARKGALPGVSGDYRIAKPAPVPEPDDAFPSSGNGQFKIGDTDVRISGSITVDVGVGGIKPPR